jgi:hypothetical protein
VVHRTSYIRERTTYGVRRTKKLSSHPKAPDHITNSRPVMDSFYTAADVEARYNAVKKENGWSILKIYDDGGVKVIDNMGVFFLFDSFEDFMKKTTKHVARPAIRR